MIGTGQASEQTYIINQSSQGKRDAVFEGRLYHGQAPSERLKWEEVHFGLRICTGAHQLGT